MPATLQIKEILSTLQGEGPSAGRPCVLVRLAGCGLRCRWCDSEFAFEGGETLGVPEVVRRVKERGLPLVLVTGGEPLEQESCPELLEALVAEGLEVELETGGHRSVGEVPPKVKILMDLKAPGSAMERRQAWGELGRLKATDALKCVLTSREDYDWIKAQIEGPLKTCKASLWLTPAHPVAPREGHELSHPGLEPAQLAEWMVADNLPVRMQLQLHKQVWGAAEGH
ncbi:MAG: radical SAM protein [Planctomycetota bacterium]